MLTFNPSSCRHGGHSALVGPWHAVIGFGANSGERGDEVKRSQTRPRAEASKSCWHPCPIMVRACTATLKSIAYHQSLSTMSQRKGRPNCIEMKIGNRGRDITAIGAHSTYSYRSVEPRIAFGLDVPCKSRRKPERVTMRSYYVWGRRRIGPVPMRRKRPVSMRMPRGRQRSCKPPGSDLAPSMIPVG